MRITPALAGLLALPIALAQLNKLAEAAGKLYLGSATDNSELSNSSYLAIISDTDEFGEITPGNGQKWQYTEPSQGTFSYTSGDQIVDLAEANGQLVRCHTLVWHSQLPSWVSSGSWTTAQLTSIIQTHIANEVSHYKGQCYSWDVVNEALNEDGTYRTSVFYTVLGTDYIPIAFEAAAAADPAAKLYYNDYNIEYSGAKHTAAVGIIDLIQTAGAKIDGVGLQAHFIVGSSPGQADLTNVLKAYVAAGVSEVAYTELDIRFTTLPYTAAGLQQQASDYAAVTKACLAVNECVGITIWDFTDKYSWIPSTFAGQGGACLYDENFSKKPAWTTVSSILAAAATSTATGGTITTKASTTTIIATAATTTTLATSTRTSITTAATPTSTGGAHYAQCGGIGWAGPTTCLSPYTCTKQNDYYSQCL
ncbi:putative endo-1,4-beta-xylanase [Pseudomassariella vexata]|uniref:Beta-xylanase n=1 Tax=Pseudomassariella vexata TaxID=1141098 RepID=A0A1Y2EAX7_9PEZI|nr:putative endo-1,4-beta-xylanase [Pseudomassariella vexata]ORY68567.1 putative endo-1,4-beta-xylanase [Pseudomassariella vexata]